MRDAVLIRYEIGRRWSTCELWLGIEIILSGEEGGTASFSSCQIRDCMRFSIVCLLLASREVEGGFICGESLKGDRDILSQLGKVTLHLYLITFCVTYLLAIRCEHFRVDILHNSSRGFTQQDF